MDKNKALKIAKKYCKTEPAHGMPHINALLKNFKKINGNKKILDLIWFAIVLHDIGKKREVDDLRHGFISGDIFKNKYKKYFKESDYECIKFAIEGHTDGKKIDECLIYSKDKQYICLSILLALDNMDAIGEDGFYRDLVDFRQRLDRKNFPNSPEDKRMFLHRLLTNYSRIDENKIRLKIIENKIYVKDLLDHYDNLKKRSEEIILDFVDNKFKIDNRKIKNLSRR